MQNVAEKLTEVDKFFEKNYPDTPTTLNFSAFETKNVIFGRNRNIISA